MDIIATRCEDEHESYKTNGSCWSAKFNSETGAEIEISIKTIARQPNISGTLGVTDIEITVFYRDLTNYFNGANELFPFIGVLKTKYLNQGSPLNTVDGNMRNMPKTQSNEYKVTFTSYLDNSPSLHQEMIAGLTMAFTSVYPHTGNTNWDSNGHKNHGVWLR